MVSLDEFDKVVADNSVVLVDFWAEWCPHCISMMPAVDSVSSQLQGKARVVKINAGSEIDVANKYHVTSLPTFLIFKNGELIDRFNGSTTPSELRQKMTLAIQ